MAEPVSFLVGRYRRTGVILRFYFFKEFTNLYLLFTKDYFAIKIIRDNRYFA